MIIMTGNLGTSGTLNGGLGFSRDSEEQTTRAERALKEFFRPEFLNRVDETVVFDPLREPELLQIVDLIAGEERGRLAELDRALALTEAARKQLAAEGADPAYGARPLRRAFQRCIENPLSKRLLAGEFPEGSTITADYSAGEFTFTAG